jgi:hypothetical protein
MFQEKNEAIQSRDLTWHNQREEYGHRRNEYIKNSNEGLCKISVLQDDHQAEEHC